MRLGGRRMSNILIVTHWTSGDVFPFIKLGYGLKKIGHEVTIFTHCHYEENIKKLGMNFVAVDTESEFQNMTDDFHMLTDPINCLDDVLEFNRRFHGKEKLLSEVEKICACYKENETVIIARHRSSISGILAAELEKCPVISVFLAPNYLAHLELHELVMGKEMCKEINKARESLNLKPINNWAEWMCSCDCLVGVWPEWYGVEEDPSIDKLKQIGFVIDKEKQDEAIPDEIVHILSDEKPVVLITGGTSTMIDHEFYKVSAAACGLLDVNAILVTPFPFLLPDVLPENVTHLESANLDMIMKKAKVVIHHGGIGTMCECIKNAVPQIILPNYADRPDNAFRIRDMGIGLSLIRKRWKPELLASNIEKAMHEIESEKLLYYQKKIIEEDTVAKLNSLVEELLTNG